jgi:hypothetical protein
VVAVTITAAAWPVGRPCDEYPTPNANISVANQGREPDQCYADLMSAMFPLGSPEGGGPVGLIALRQVSVALLAAHAREPPLAALGLGGVPSPI